MSRSNRKTVAGSKQDWEKRNYEINRRMLIFTIIGVAVAIIAVVISLQNFSDQIQLQRDIEFNEFLSDVRSLEIELEKDIEAMNNLVNENFTGKTFHEQYIMENLKRSVADGRIMNDTVKTLIISAYWNGVGLNNRILYINSPEFITFKFSNETFSRDVEHFIRQTQNITEVKFVPIFELTLTYISDYKTCLEKMRNVTAC